MSKRITEATINRLQKGMEGMIARLEKQNSKIQNVSDQLELRKAAPQVVVNDQ